MGKKHYDVEKDIRYLELLAKSFPTVAEASTEIINLQAILNLPKGTEHFLADLHGAYPAFQHVLKNASGNIKRKVGELFGNEIRESEKRELCTLIYYPERKLELVKQTESDMDDWYHITIHQLVKVCREVSSKYTRSKVRKALPQDFSYIIQELLHERTEDIDKAAYVKGIIDTIIDTGRADDFIMAICDVIQRLVIDQLHILGDIFDRGPGAHLILDMLKRYKNWDIQWGNHDVLWMGACAGNDACICNVIRLCLRYANLTTLEEAYGINMIPLATFAMETYGDDPCTEFMPKTNGGSELLDEKNARLTAMMHKAIAILQFKVESQIFHKHPEWQMEDRDLLSTINFEKKTCMVDGKEYPMTSCNFPTIKAGKGKSAIELTPEEQDLMNRLHHSFTTNEKLRKHIKLIFSHGCMYSIINHNLLFHASCPLNADGTLKEVHLYNGKKYSGKDLMHYTGMLIRSAFQGDTNPEERDYGIDYFLYLWCGPDSILFDKSKMATFERYFIEDKATHKEQKGNYFKLRDNEEICDHILDAFEVKGPNRHIINGHVPVHAAEGENPIKANGKLMVIDGGFSQAYHKTTGIAGYTLVYHSRGFQLVQHEPFTSEEDAVRTGADIKSTTQIVEMTAHRMLVADTDIGTELKKQVDDLRELLYAYRHGFIKEKR
ncbi:MAG: fructose-1,6-bisphosphatase [Prevotella sp.]|nr:fructose-1,6-bisphosphatase [Prevotella sp.]